MTLAQLQAYISTLGEDKILGFNFDNSRRAYRSIINSKPAIAATSTTPAIPAEPARVEAFSDKFEIDTALEALIVAQTDSSGIAFKTYIPIETIQGVCVVETEEDALLLDRRYSIG